MILQRETHLLGTHDIECSSSSGSLYALPLGKQITVGDGWETSARKENRVI